MPGRASAWVDYTAGVDHSGDTHSAAALPGSLPPPAARRPRALDPLPISIFLALVFTAAGLVELLTRGPVPVGPPGR